jgi:hypothetical protein
VAENQVMEAITVLFLLMVLAAPIALVNAWFVSGGVMGIARAFGPAPPMAWPEGVQEDDDFHWTWTPAAADEPPAVAEAVSTEASIEASIEDLPIDAGPPVERVRPD